MNAASQAVINQIHLNLERIRVPEVVFRPSIAGVDQAGIVEIAGDVLTQRLAGLPSRDDFLRDIFRRAATRCSATSTTASATACAPCSDARLDAWKGAAAWAGSPAWREARISKEEYQEKGPEYIKEHEMGNSYA
ncbi:hypothetical protein CDD83_5811 [Cordyceps sp. RAO-2017]|nr:hypothetical protein CDD83_5811 [Cordyceps sp. RAO-2017]